VFKLTRLHGVFGCPTTIRFKPFLANLRMQLHRRHNEQLIVAFRESELQLTWVLCLQLLQH
jgi:hypothetical protein